MIGAVLVSGVVAAGAQEGGREALDATGDVPTTSTAAAAATTTTSEPLPVVGPPFVQTCDEPSEGLSDPAATRAARCLFAAIEASGDGTGDLPIGQQLRTSDLSTRDPVASLDAETYATGPAPTPAVIGSDLGAMARYVDQGDPTSIGILDDHIAALVDDAQAGRLVVLTWHARNPFSGGPAGDDTGVDLPQLLDPTTEAARSWARQTDQVIELLRRFADAGVAVALRPLHEVNLRSFWWGQPDPGTYRQLWDQLRDRVERAGLHDLVWVFAPSHPYSPAIPDPLVYTPDRFDVFGIDSFDPERSEPEDHLRLSTSVYDRIIALGRPFAFTETGPNDSADGMWDPATVTTAVSERYPRTAWAMFWATFADDQRFAIVDLVGHEAWWARCHDGTCPTTRPG